MSACDDRFEQISMLLDGELSEEAEAELRAHLSRCPDCAAVYAALSGVGDALTEEPPAHLHEKIMGGVDQAIRAQKAQRRFRILRPTLTAAACLVVIVGTVFFAGQAVRSGRAQEKAALQSAGAAAVPKAAMAPVAPPDAASGAGPSFASDAEEAPAEKNEVMMEVPAAPMLPAPEEAEPAAAAADSMVEGSLFAVLNAPRFTGTVEELTEDGALRVTVTDPGDTGLSAGDAVLVRPPEGLETLPEPASEVDITLDGAPIVLVQEEGEERSVRAVSIEVIK